MAGKRRAGKPKAVKGIEKGAKELEKAVKKNWKKIIWIIIISAVIISIVSVITGIRVSFALRDSLAVNLAPAEKSFTILNNQNQNETFYFSVENSFFCKANCSYALYDRSESNLLDKGTLVLKNKGYLNKTYGLEPYRKGSGQKIYNFEVECHNIRSFMCATEGPARRRSSFITLNYGLTEKEEELKSDLKPMLVESIELINNASRELQISGYMLNRTADLAGLDSLYDKYYAALEYEGTFITGAREAAELWSNQEYIQLNESHGKSLRIKAAFLYGKSKELIDEIISSIDRQNSLIKGYNDIKNYFFRASKSNEKYIYNSSHKGNITLEFDSIYRELELIKNSIAGNFYLYLDDFEKDINHTVFLIERFDMTLSQNCNEIVLKGKNISYFERSKKCSLGFCENLTEDFCVDLNNIFSEYEDRSYEVPEGFSLPEEDYYLVSGGSVKILVSNESKEYYNRYCLNDTNTDLFTLDIGDIRLIDVPDLMNTTIEEPIKGELAENLPMCCVYRQCSPCCDDEECKNDASLFPVVFIHGHSLLRGPTPEPLLDVFNKVQYQLQDDGYINAGTIYYDLVDYKKNEWGLSRFPITVKASYYYDYFYSLGNYVYITKSTENIDTYAVRLNDMVKILKYKTGKPKVNIIAHSMGGLVVRRYMQIFGDDSVNKVILIATPNHGIGDSIQRFCGIFGEKKECEDMYKDSLLIKKLDDPNYRPGGARVYTISGIGCRTEDSDGDGVVTLQSSQLDYAVPYAVNGTCSDIFKKEFHKDILDIDRYSKTYSYIKEILEEK